MPLVWINRGLIALAVASPTVLFTLNAWLEYRHDLVAKNNRPSLTAAIERERRATERQEVEIRAEIRARLTLAAQVAMADLPGLAIKETGNITRLTSDWHPDPDNPDVRWQITVTIALYPFNHYRDSEFAQVARLAVDARARRQQKGMFGLWLEDTFSPEDRGSWGESEMERNVAEALKRAILNKAIE